MKSQIGVGRLQGGVYYIDEFASPKIQANTVGSHQIWHGCLGLPSDQILSLLPKILNISSVGNKEPCSICFKAKQTLAHFVASESHEKELFGLIHCDICGAYRVPSLFGSQYFLSIVDDANKAVWVYLMREKEEASLLLQNFMVMLKTQFGNDVKIRRSDNGLEFLFEPMK